ncbi:DNA repair protein RecO [Candidatus Formimonas warabiya]|uniref:DNA repair protein RecO n=1 Tax=Formimonas warabiya TaxID=1761012 RepID=A0A3G1KXS3_FORW1|nr:DNA repair protein RecO [Candidatus Formimonas warabiya]ATW27323.1 DNA repair protein RecO [Candidatus Formimonas warabiya]
MTKLYSVDALVVRTRDFGEADKILTLYTKEQGKVQAIAKGVRKPTSRLRGGVQMFSHSRMLLYRGRSLDTVSQAETVEAFGGLQDDLLRLIYASYLAELLDGAVPDREPNEKLFLLTLLCLGLLLGDDPELICRLYEIRLLYLLGYQPYLTECMLCHRSLGGGSFFLDPEAGGILCQNCVGDRGAKSAISPGTVLTMQKMLSMDPRQIFRLKISPMMRNELEKAFEHYLEYHLDKTLKAKRVLKTLETWGRS